MKDPIQPYPIRASSQAVAEAKELQTLLLAHRYGHLRRVDVARALWPSSAARVAEKMAHRTVGRLSERGWILEVFNILGGHSLMLAKTGAVQLRARGIYARQGCDMSSITSPDFFHRMLCTCYLIRRQGQGHQSFGEHAITMGQAPARCRELQSRFHKLPDGIVVVPGAERGYEHATSAADWIQAVSSRKPYEELKRIFDLARKSGAWLDDAHTVILDRVVVLYDDRTDQGKSIKQALQRYVAAREPSDPSIHSSIWLARCNIRPPLTWCGCETVDAATLLYGGRSQTDMQE